MGNPFFEHPILNSPYDCPKRHWELDSQGQPTQQIVENRRRAEFIAPIPKPKKRKGASRQQSLVFDEGKGLSTQEQQYDPTSIIAEFTEVYRIEADLRAKVESQFNKMIETAVCAAASPLTEIAS